MTRKERVIAALNHQDTDFVPYHVDLTGQAMERLKAHWICTTIKNFRSAFRLCTILGLAYRTA